MKAMTVVPIEVPQDIDDEDWGYWISVRARRRRRALGLTQQGVVDSLEAQGHHITPATWSRAESGKAELARGATLLMLMAEGLDCTVTFLLGLTADPDSWEPDG